MAGSGLTLAAPQTRRPRGRHALVLAGPGVGASRRKETIAMPKDSRALTRAARARMAATGETYTQARAGILTPPRMDRDTPPDGLVTALMALG